jgi:phosphatidylinositol-3-phosphatase
MNRILAAVLGSLTLVATSLTGSPAAVTPRSHIMFILLENREYGAVTSSSMPFLYGQAQRYVLLTNEYAITHPSLPDYIALIAGSTYGIHTNCKKGIPRSGWPCNLKRKSLVDKLGPAGISWKAYMENLPAPCSNVERARGGYVKRHDPFMYFNNIRNRPWRCRRVVPLTQLRKDLASNRLPRFSFVTPNLCHSAHDCPLSAADRFLSSWVPRILARMGSTTGGTGVIFVTFDEGTTNNGCCGGQAAGGHVFTTIIGPGAKLHTKISTELHHYSLLRAVFDNWGLPRMNKTATAPELLDWQS